LIEIDHLKVSTLYLSREQTYRGRCVIAVDGHVNELYELGEEELELYIKDIAKAANAIKKAFSPDKINYGAYGDKLPHLHFHLAPKYKEKHNWGAPFDSSPNPGVTLSEEEYSDMINQIRKYL